MNQQVKPGFADPSLHAPQQRLEEGSANFRQKQANSVCPAAGKRAGGRMRNIVQCRDGRKNPLGSYYVYRCGAIQYSTDSCNGNTGSLSNIGNCWTGR